MLIKKYLKRNDSRLTRYNKTKSIYRLIFNDRDDAKLIIDLERQLAHQTPNMVDLRQIMYSLDRNRNDFLSANQVHMNL